MLDKLKKVGNQISEKTGRGMEYAKGKTQGFKHPEPVEAYIQVLRWNRGQIPKLYERVNSLAEKHKDLAQSENKLNAEFAVLGGHENEHPGIAAYLKAYGEASNAIAENHFIYHAKIDEVRTDWKAMDSRDLNEIGKLHDKANHALSDARYWRNQRNPSKLSEMESKYRQFSCEMADAINRLREGKESLFPDYIRRLAEAQLEYYHSCVRASEQLLQSLNSVGPVRPAPVIPLDPNFDMGDLGLKAEEKANASGGSSSSSAPPPVAARGPATRSARGMYAFSATNPDELSFNVGDVMQIIDMNGDWWTAELRGHRGLIPANYVQLV